MDTRAPQTEAQTPNKTDRRLGKHLLLIVLIKLLVLYGLWYGLIRPNKVKVTTQDIEQIYTRSGGPMAQPASTTP
ncbi:hypothetical protein DTO96_100626 [Ephemeroptericola cinctiostellae]|uniref:Uncharacterized protein n=1 Tax=Ephemeroptericola cinctiostellae TaxID=2268024 RepID=A0A345D972_9BURK|nr:cytochrome oxidase putative small subunit CydP [Ephemeroptericola cinctiostellae]AXF84910.1 hypothetical protein DTO96_100626 [Ephemeroptericola cinctiostellae]